MIDFFASITIALIIVMTVVILISNYRQAQVLKQMRVVMEDWYAAKMRDRRETFRKNFKIKDGFEWLGNQVQLTVIEQGRKLENPRAVEFFTQEGPRLVISPLDKRRLRAALRASEGKKGKVSKLVQPLLGHRQRKVQVINRSTRTAHEWYDLEIEVALAKLGINWGELKRLNFYLVPQRTNRGKENIASGVIGKATGWIQSKFQDSVSRVKQNL
jgi:hypothetical protein